MPLLSFPFTKVKYGLVIMKALELSVPHRERADISKAQIEHIMPRKLTSEWRMSLGPKADDIRDKWLDTVGNLTVVYAGSNSELSNASFLAKRKQYNKSGFILTRGLYQQSTLVWGEAQIISRGKWLAEKAKDIWIGPDA
jgi:hypothetical protein